MKKRDQVLGDEHGAVNMTKILRARCFAKQKELVHDAARAIGLDEADLIQIGATRYASEILYRSPALHGAL